MGRTISITKVGRRPRPNRRAYVAHFFAGTPLQYRFIEYLMVGTRPKRFGRVHLDLWKARFRATVHLIHSTMCNLEINYGGGNDGFNFDFDFRAVLPQGHGSFAIWTRMGGREGWRLMRDQGIDRASEIGVGFDVRFRSVLPSIPIPFAIWEEMGGRGTWEWLRDQGIVDHVSEPDHDHHRCREFRLSECVIREFISIGIADPANRSLNLFTGKPASRVRRSPATDPSRHPWFPRGSVGAVAYEALSSARCFINYPAMKAEVAAMRAEADRVNTPRNRRRALCAEAALLSIRLHGGLRREPSIGAEIWSYQPAYRPSYPGRLHEIGLGVQGCPRRIKGAAFSYQVAINYDLTGALAAALLAVVQQYNTAIQMAGGTTLIDDRWLRRYVEDPRRGSAWLADRLQVSRDIAKRILYAIMFGGRRRGAVRDILMEAHDGDTTAVERALRRVGYVLCWQQAGDVAGFLQMLDQLDDVVYEHITRQGPFRAARITREISAMRVNRSRHGTSAVNAVGRVLLVLDEHGRRAVRDDGARVAERHIRCHLTQGIEQQFIASVIVELLNEPSVVAGKIRIMSQQHDGFVIWSSLSREDADAVVQRCVARARRGSVLGVLARLEIKAIG